MWAVLPLCQCIQELHTAARVHAPSPIFIISNILLFCERDRELLISFVLFARTVPDDSPLYAVHVHAHIPLLWSAVGSARQMKQESNGSNSNGALAGPPSLGVHVAQRVKLGMLSRSLGSR
jgi:hypothetical protein